MASSILQIHKGRKDRLWVVGETETQQYLQVLQKEDVCVPFQKVDRLEREFTEITTDTAGNKSPLRNVYFKITST